jgi:hypothetical protein
MSPGPEIGHGQNPTPDHAQTQEQTQKQTHKQTQKQTHRPQFGSGIYVETALEPEEAQDESLLDEAPDSDNFETEEDDVAQSGYWEVEETGDPFFVPSFSLTPVKWLWVPAPEGRSRLLWATSDLMLRMDAVEIFRLFLTRVLNVIYHAENALYPQTVRTEGYMPPGPLELQGFFLKKWLSGLVSVWNPQKSAEDIGEDAEIPGGNMPKSKKQFSWANQLSYFTIAVPTKDGYRFIQPGHLIFGSGSGGKYLHSRKALFMRWMKFECNEKGRDEERFHDAARLPNVNGWFFRCANTYVRTLNTQLTPWLGQVFTQYDEEKVATLRDVLINVRKELFPEVFKKPKKTKPER